MCSHMSLENKTVLDTVSVVSAESYREPRSVNLGLVSA